jgi:putative membrane protein
MKTRQINILSSASSVAIASVLALAAVACGGSDQQNAKNPNDETTTTMTAANTTPPPANPPEPVSPTGAATTGREGDPSQTPPAALSTGNGPAPTEAQPTLSDAQILEITHTANAGEIAQAKLALNKGKDARVKKFAGMMVREHTDADAKGMKVAKHASLTPATSPTSDSLQSDADSNTTALKGQMGADFDKSYVDVQVKEHQAVLDTIDQKLVPSAQSADVKAYLADVRTAVATHLQHAKDLQDALSSTASTMNK